MAQGAPDAQSMFDFLVDDSPEQIVAGMPVSPQFETDVLDATRHPAAHATVSGDQPSRLNPAPAQQIRSINPAALQPTPLAGVSPPGGQQQALAERPLMYPTRPSYDQTRFGPSPMLNWSSSPLAIGIDEPTSASSNFFGCNSQSEYITPNRIVNNSELDNFSYGISWQPGRTRAATTTAPQSFMTIGLDSWNDEDEFEDGELSITSKSEDVDVEPRPVAGFTGKQQREKEDAIRLELASGSPSTTTYSQNCRAGLGSKASILTSTVSGSTASGRPSKLRSASRTSQNTHHKPAETAEERRTRASHNLVEKQYRNRLNAQFEALLNCLPEQFQGGGGNEDSEPALDFTDKRVSKAEVLDMARRYIKALERERDALERERSELLGNIDKLRKMYKRQEGDSNDGHDDVMTGVGASVL